MCMSNMNFCFPVSCKLSYCEEKLIIMELFFYIFLLLLVYGFYKSVYFDIPRGIVLAKHAKGASEFIELDDGSLVHVRDEGILEKDVIVLIHGFNGSLFNFEPMVSYLKDNFRIFQHNNLIYLFISDFLKIKN